ncbi:MAG TPA: hypothetical protein VN604_00755 [Nitrospirota bacterium]|nr:hypothetical protein [Nitrospirota bacterium]
MNMTEAKGTVEAAAYFKEEVLEIMPDIPREELSEMVEEYIYYHQPEVSKDEAHEIVEKNCIRK